MYAHFLKRLFDFCISLVAIIVLSPILVVVTIWLHFVNKGAGAFFTQERPGKDAKIFRVIKFKTMTDERDADGNLLPDVQRLTRVGKVVRSLSLDELPQLFNVLKGDMSLVGTRPPTKDEWALYEDHHRARMAMRPGITGMWQVSGRSNITDFEEIVRLDTKYIDQWSLGLDLKILVKTVLVVLKHEGSM